MGADMSKHLLPLSDLDVAAPGVLSVVFGPDGRHIDAPLWSGPITILCAPARDGHAFLAAPVEDDGVWLSAIEGNGHGMATPDFWPWSERLVIDLRIPSVAARLLALLRRLNVQRRAIRTLIRVLTDRHISGTWTESDAADLGVVVLALAPQIAALTESP